MNNILRQKLINLAREKTTMTTRWKSKSYDYYDKIFQINIIQVTITADDLVA